MHVFQGLHAFAGTVALTVAAASHAEPAAGAPVPGNSLTDVPRIGYDVHLCPFPGALYSLLQAAGDPVAYDTLMGVTGAAFRRIWNRDDGGNVDLMYLAPEPYRRGFEALGYSYRTVPRTRAAMAEAIRASIAAGRPVIAFGFIGPPEAGLITGHGPDVETVFGWSYFQPGEPYRLDDWFETLSEGPPFGLIVVGERTHPRPDPRTTVGDALEWAVDLGRRARRPGHPDHVFGLAAYDAWAAALEVDADYPADNREVMTTRAMVHCDQVVMLSERESASRYLAALAEEVPEIAAPLRAAAALYADTGRMASLVWHWGHWQDPAALAALADPATRREFAAAVRQARDTEAEALSRLEDALRGLHGGVLPTPIPGHLELVGSRLVNYPPEFRPNIEGMPVPSALRALVEFVGEDFGYSTMAAGGTVWRTNEAFPYFMALWGDSFEFVWLRRDAPAELPSGPGLPADVRTRFERVLAAAGFECDVVLPGEAGGGGGDADLRERTVASVADRGLPVLLVGIPEPGHAALVTGYADHGMTLIGWSAEGGDDRGIRFEPEKQARRSDSPARAEAVMFPIRRRERVPEPEAVREALAEAVRLLRRRELGDFHAGAATFDAWVGLLADPALSAGGPEALERGRRILDPMIWDLATRRHYASLFLQRAATLFPAVADHLEAAAASFRAEHDMMWEVNRLAGAQWPGQALPKIGEADVRAQIAAVLVRARDEDLAAADRIEQALADLGR